MLRRVFAVAAILSVVLASAALAACCGDCIKDPPCCQKPKT